MIYYIDIFFYLPQQKQTEGTVQGTGLIRAWSLKGSHWVTFYEKQYTVSAAYYDHLRA